MSRSPTPARSLSASTLPKSMPWTAPIWRGATEDMPHGSPAGDPSEFARWMGHAADMHFVGVDLAGGDRRPTGLAVPDDTIAAALSPDVEGSCLVAIDARLIGPTPRGTGRLKRHSTRTSPASRPKRIRPTPSSRSSGMSRAGHGSRAGSAGRPPPVDDGPQGDRGLPPPGDPGAVPAGTDAEIQGQARTQPRPDPFRRARSERVSAAAAQRNQRCPAGTGVASTQTREPEPLGDPPTTSRRR